MKPKSIYLTNGLKCIYIQNNNFLSTVVHLRGLCGSNYENITEVGASHILEHLILSNLDDFTKTGGNVVGVTSRDDVLFMAKTLNKHVSTSLKFLAQHVFDTKLDSVNFDLQKNISINEILRHQNNPEKMVSRLSPGLLFNNKRFSYLNTGNVTEIKKLTFAKVLGFRKRLYNPANFVLVACGGFNEQRVIRDVQKYFSDIEGVSNKKYISTLPKKGWVYRNYLMATSQTHMKIDFVGYTLENSNFRVSQILAQMITSHLNQNLKQQKGVVYRANCTSLGCVNYGIFSLYTATNDYKYVLNILKELIANYKELLSQKDFELAKAKILTNYIFYIDHNAGIADFYSERLLCKNVSPDHALELGLYKKVSFTDIRRVSQEILSQKPKILLISKEKLILRDL